MSSVVGLGRVVVGGLDSMFAIRRSKLSILMSTSCFSCCMFAVIVVWNFCSNASIFSVTGDNFWSKSIAKLSMVSGGAGLGGA